MKLALIKLIRQICRQDSDKLQNIILVSITYKPVAIATREYGAEISNIRYVLASFCLRNSQDDTEMDCLSSARSGLCLVLAYIDLCLWCEVGRVYGGVGGSVRIID